MQTAYDVTFPESLDNEVAGVIETHNGTILDYNRNRNGTATITFLVEATPDTKELMEMFKTAELLTLRGQQITVKVNKQATNFYRNK